MWTSTLELTLGRVLATRLLGRFWRGAYFSSFAPFQVQNLPRQSLPDSRWVRVRNTLAGVSGSDLDLIFVDRAFNIAPAALPPRNPIYLGHEVVGEVIEIGDEVQRLHAGERVVLQYGPNCVTANASPLCRSCAVDNYSLCEYGAFHGMQAIGGGWSEEMLLHEQQLFRVPDDLTNAQAVLLEPSAVAIHAVLRHLPKTGDRVLIIGAGTIGLLILQVVRALAPEAEVHVLARHTFQVERATRLGAAQIIYPRDSYEGIQLATGAQLYQQTRSNRMLLGGYDVIYDTAGSQQSIYDELRWARAGATIVMVGFNLHRMQLDLTPLWYQEIQLIGSINHGSENWPLGTNEHTTTFEIATEMIRRGQLHPEKLITHSYPLNDYRSALLTATDKARNHAIKVIFDYSKQPPSVVPNVRASARSRPRALTADLEPHLSQPLDPRNVEEYQGKVGSGRRERDTPLVQAPSLPALDDVEDENDMKTVVVRPPQRRFGSTSATSDAPSAFQSESNRDHKSDDDETQMGTPSRLTRFGVTPHCGNLPGFAPGLDELGIPEEEDETSKNVAVTAPSAMAAPPVEAAPAEEREVTSPQESTSSIKYFEESADESDMPFTYFEEVEVIGLNDLPAQEEAEQRPAALATAHSEPETAETMSMDAPGEAVAGETGEALFAFPDYTDADHDYAWTQFLAPPDGSQESDADGEEGEHAEHRDGPVPTQAIEQEPVADAMLTPLSLDEDEKERETRAEPESEPVLTQNTEVSSGSSTSIKEASDTVTSISNKRGRSKRKTASMRNGNNRR